MLNRAIHSILAQTYPHFQVCVYDNASQDETSQVVSSIAASDNRVKYHVHPKNIGPNNNYQYALKKVTSPFFAFLADDDLLLPNCLEEAMQRFAEIPEIGMFVGKIIIMDQKKKMRGLYLDDWEGNRCYSPKEIMNNFIHSHSILLWTSMVFRKEVIDKIGFLNTDVFWHDIEFLLRSSSQFSLFLTNNPCGIIHEHTANSTLSVVAKDFFDIRSYIKQTAMNASFFSEQDKMELIHVFEKETPKIIFRDSFYSFFLKGRFHEMLKAIDLLEQHYFIGRKEKIIRFSSNQCLRFKFLFPIIKLVLFLRKKLLRKFHHNKVKNQIPETSIESFKTLIKI
jgi:glycosyltransferase involved in cell wall biosynthesis